MTEVYLMFLQAALQLFVNLYKFLQRGDSILPVLLQEIKSYLTKLLGRFVKVETIRAYDYCRRVKILQQIKNHL